MRISGCRISPPMLAARDIRPNVASPASRTAVSVPCGTRDNRRYCHSPSHARAPVSSMNQSASNAAVSCASIMALETSGVFANASFADVPVTNAGIDSRAMQKKIPRLARFRSSLLASDGRDEHAQPDDHADGREMIQ